MNTTAPGRGGLVGSLLSAAIGALALVICLAVIVLSDDDLGYASPGGPGGPGIPGTGSDGGDGGSDSVTKAVPAQPDLSACTEKECPKVGPPNIPPGVFPYPPGTTAPQWTDDFCADTATSSGTVEVRQVRMSLTQVRDWYLTHLLDAGYGWGGYGPVHANPFTTDDAGNEVVLGWDDSLTTQDESRRGRLAIVREYGGQSLCGPPPGTVFIQVTLP